MLKVPLPFLGARGIRYFADRVGSWPSYARDEDQLSHQVMMIHIILEERGTGGGGFRFLYAAFLQEAAQVLGSDELAGLSREMMENGDRWREISLFVARIGRRREFGPERFAQLREMLLERADAERDLFTRLRAAVQRG